LASLDNVDTALSVSEIALTIPRVLTAVPAPMVTDCDGSARFFAANRVGVLVADIVSVSVRIFALAFVTVELMVIVSVRVLTMACAPLLTLATLSDIVIV
jgi:hypothetical protein